MKLSVNVKIKRTFLYYLNWYLIKIMLLTRIIKNEHDFYKYVNKLFFNDKVFKYKKDEGKWSNLDIFDHHVVLEEVKK